MPGFEIIFSKKYSNRWQMIASYHYLKPTGNVPRITTGGFSPNEFVNASIGNISMPHIFKIMGSYLLPLDINLAITGYLMSGSTWNWFFTANLPSGTRTSFNMYPPEDFKQPNKKNLDIRISKQFHVGGKKLEIMADVFNVFNSYDATLFYVAGSLFGKIWSLKDPRSYEIGLRFIY